LRRREFIPLLGGTIALGPLVVRAESRPVVGFLSSRVRHERVVNALQQGLGDEGFAEGKNAGIEYRFAEGRFDRLPVLLNDLVRRSVAVIVTQGSPAAVAVKAASTSIPLVFVAGFDPVRAGFVASLSRPGGNATGVSLILHVLAAKRLALILELVPRETEIAALLNPTSPNAEPELREMQAVAQEHRRTLHVINASTQENIRAAFVHITQRQIGALVVGSDPFLADQSELIASHAASLAIPAVYPFRDSVEAGGLLSLGTSLRVAYRQAGVLVGRILKGTKPAELPVQQPTTFEIVINAKTARALGITIPETVFVRADEVIE
jgi:putative tryptophan/tyrosine transport system substrate-binding protein